MFYVAPVFFADRTAFSNVNVAWPDLHRAFIVVVFFNVNNNLKDEAHFHLHGAINKHNIRYWAEQVLAKFKENLLIAIKLK